jgi:hypothetical protein
MNAPNEPVSPAFTVVVHPETMADLAAYGDALSTGAARAGVRLRAYLDRAQCDTRDPSSLLDALIATKSPRIYAESEVVGNGSDWNATELSLLGGVGVATEVMVFDDGTHRSPTPHGPPFSAWLLFTPGPLLRCDAGGVPADWHVVSSDGTIDFDRYRALVERRVLPLLHFMNERASAADGKAVITVPGLGCGQFAGRFSGQMGRELERALGAILAEHAPQLSALRCVHYDPYGECEDGEQIFAGLHYRVRPLHGALTPDRSSTDPSAFGSRATRRPPRSSGASSRGTTSPGRGTTSSPARGPPTMGSRRPRPIPCAR